MSHATSGVESPGALAPVVDPATAVELRLLGLQDAAKAAPWSGSVSAGASASFGNTRTSKANVNAAAEYKLNAKDRVKALFDWFYSEEKNQFTKATTVTQKRVRGALQYDRFIDEKLYAWGRIEGIDDELQALDLRLILSGGLGYQFFDRDDAKLSAEAGLAYTRDDFEGGTDDESVSLRFAARYFRQITADLKYNGTIEWLPSLEDTDDHLVLGTNQLDYNLGKGFVTSLRYEFDYDNTPSPGADRIDHRVVWGLGFTF